MSIAPRVGPRPIPLSAWLSGRLLAAAAWNAALAVAAIAALTPEVPGPVRMLGAGLVVLVLPGAAWLGAFRRALDPPRLALALVGISSVVTVLALGVTALGDGDPSRSRLLAVVAVTGTAGLLALGPPRRLASGAPWLLLAAVAACGFGLAAASALFLVPPLEDHDMEVRGTAWGLAATGRPWFQTNRETPLPLAHPVLFHAHVAQSLLVTGEIGATHRSYTSARGTAAARAAGVPVDTMQVWREDYAAFLAEPALVGTRSPSALLSGLTLALLLELVRRLTGSRSAGLLAAALFALAPETVVRAAYAGYFAPATFAMLTAAMLMEAPPVGRRPELGWIASAAALCALLDHKSVVLVLGVLALGALHAALAALRAPGERLRALAAGLDARIVALTGGFALATVAWWSYGLWVDARGFVDDHLRMHLAHRILLNDLRVTADPARYAPAIPELWAEFSAHTGHGLVPVALAALALWALAARAAEPRRTLAGWALAGAVLYSLTDWRQTKHLMNGLAPMVAAAVTLAWTGFPRRSRPGGEPLHAVPRQIAWTAAVLLLLSLAFEVAADVALLRDFGSMRIHGASDVDGW